jgi:hypothetical protein
MSNRLGRWYQEGEWWIRHDKTTKPRARLRMEAVKALRWGISGLFCKPEWKDSKTLRITAGFGPSFYDVVEGHVAVDGGVITSKVRFRWLFVNLLIQDKTLSDVGAMAAEVAGTRSPADSKEIFIVRDHSETAKTPFVAEPST